MKVLVIILLASFAIAADVPDTAKVISRVDIERLIQERIDQLRLEILTTYDTTGGVFAQSQNSKGWHRTFGTVTLVDGEAVVTLNVSPQSGKQVIEFMGDSTYRGHAWSLDTSNGQTYRVYPQAGGQCLIKSSDTTDTATVNFLLEGI